MKKQTAVEWLVEELKKVHHPTEAMIMYAKKLEKQQIIDFTDSYILKYLSCNYDGEKISLKETEQYYNETFKSE